jgi:hypothetical protein
LPLFGAAQIVPRNSVHPELWGDAAILVETAPAPRTRLDFVTYRTVDLVGKTAVAR